MSLCIHSGGKIMTNLSEENSFRILRRISFKEMSDIYTLWCPDRLDKNYKNEREKVFTDNGWTFEEFVEIDSKLFPDLYNQFPVEY